MIEIKDIQTAVAGVLKRNGFTVTASEVKEGFSKPTFFIDTLPVSVAAQNKYSELVTDSVTITYIPAVETREELVNMAEKIKNMFLYRPLKVNDRYLSVGEILFDTDNSALTAYFELEFLQETNISDTEMPKMKILQESVVTESHGTSSGTD